MNEGNDGVRIEKYSFCFATKSYPYSKLTFPFYEEKKKSTNIKLQNFPSGEGQCHGTVLHEIQIQSTSHGAPERLGQKHD